MSAHESLLADLRFRYPVTATYLTPDGRDLLTTEPETFEAFAYEANQLIGLSSSPKNDFELIDTGCYGYVYGMKDHPDKCLKIVARHTLRSSYRNGSSFSLEALPNLKSESWLMNAVSNRLNRRPGYKVKAPTQYGVIKFVGGSALLQQRIPEDFTTVKSLAVDQNIDDNELESIAMGAYTRARQALGRTVLKLGIGDLKIYGNTNVGNLFVERDKSINESQVYIIDLVGDGIVSKAFAWLGHKATVISY